MDNEARLNALREAAEVGLADIRAGRFCIFDAPESLHRYLTALTEEAIAAKATKPNDQQRMVDRGAMRSSQCSC